MRSYGQFCALARALDIVGDRWTLLIVRELGIRPCRYRDLQDGLPGIATNLLADRLRALEDHGLVVTEEAPPPVSATLYRLTERGMDLLPSLDSLAGWGAREMLRGQGDDEFRTHWLALPIGSFTAGVDTHDVAPLRIRLHSTEPGDRPIDVVVVADGIHAELHSTETPDVDITGSPMDILGTLFGERKGAVVGRSEAASRRFAELARRVAAQMSLA
jgi:DNA-binding HxlR family transcriptional regulator